jgi:methylglyoxal synthase
MKKLVLIAHDNLKSSLVQWALTHKHLLEKHQLYATGTTGKRLQDEVKLSVQLFKSGPLGGDQQIGAAIAENKLTYSGFLIRFASDIWQKWLFTIDFILPTTL